MLKLRQSVRGCLVTLTEVRVHVIICNPGQIWRNCGIIFTFYRLHHTKKTGKLIFLPSSEGGSVSSGKQGTKINEKKIWNRTHQIYTTKSKFLTSFSVVRTLSSAPTLVVNILYSLWSPVIRVANQMVTEETSAPIVPLYLPFNSHRYKLDFRRQLFTGIVLITWYITSSRVSRRKAS